MSDNKYLNAALEYATKYGWAVFPVSPKSKKPLTPHGCKDAKKTIGPIKNWWKKWPDASIGIATGSISQLIVIDEDLDEDKGIDGYHEIRQWERDNGLLPDTVRAITGRGGNHLYFHYTGNDIGNRTGLLEGVDIRGEGGYVIAPPSLHPNGTEYAWENGPDECEVSEINDTIQKLLQTGKEPDQNRFQLPQTIPSGARNSTLYRFACSLQAQGVPDDAIMAAVIETNRHRCLDPLSDAEITQIVSSALTHQKGELKIVTEGMPEWHEPKLKMQLDKDGNQSDRPAQTIANAEEAILFDRELYGRIRYNEIAYSPYVYGNLPWKSHKGWREWTNADDSNLRSYIEFNYGLKNSDKIMDALTNVSSKYPVNPIKELLMDCHERWDGNKHVENLLPEMLGAEKNEYNTAVMHLFMMGAVMRVFHPGCKFDYMPVFVGPQGKGKSTFLRLMSLNESWFSDNFNSLEGDKAFEKLRGMWIVEMAELQATKRAKDVETIKSFITSRVDTYRAPYGRRTEQRPRMCVLAGTSNPTDFLTDKTGNRRFLPISCNVHKAAFDLFDDDIATKAVFAQAWGEIMDEYLRNGSKIKLVLPAKLQQEALRMQTAFLEEDPKVGLIQEWLDTNTDTERVCAVMLWKEALGHPFEQYKPQDINAIHEIMKNSIQGWKYIGMQRVGKGYGTQRCYEREQHFVDLEDAESTPFD